MGIFSSLHWYFNTWLAEIDRLILDFVFDLWFVKVDDFTIYLDWGTLLLGSISSAWRFGWQSCRCILLVLLRFLVVVRITVNKRDNLTTTALVLGRDASTLVNLVSSLVLMSENTFGFLNIFLPSEPQSSPFSPLHTSCPSFARYSATSFPSFSLLTAILLARSWLLMLHEHTLCSALAIVEGQSSAHPSSNPSSHRHTMVEDI